jgi:hypothetical protein
VAETSRMFFDIRAGDRLEFAGFGVELIHKTGRIARLCLTVPRDVRVVALERKDSADEWLAKGAVLEPSIAR